MSGNKVSMDNESSGVFDYDLDHLYEVLLCRNERNSSEEEEHSPNLIQQRHHKPHRKKNLFPIKLYAMLQDLMENNY